jgi:class I fructose-bisphosphate aldolase
MDSRTGKKIRLGRILDAHSHRAIIVAASHAVLTGAPKGLRTVADMNSVFSQLAGANGIMVAPGSVQLVEEAFVGREKPSLVLHMDWKSHGRKVLRPGENGISEGSVASIATVDRVAAAGADAIMSYLYVGHKDNGLERQEIERNARLAADCERLGIVLIIEPRAVMDYTDHTQVANPELLGWYCRMASEIGADVVKCIWPGSRGAYEDIVSQTTVPVVLAGGPGSDDRIEETMRLAEDTVLAGGSGVMFGRRIYSSKSPAAVLAGLKAVVHEGATADEGLALFFDFLAQGILRNSQHSDTERP